MARIMRRASRSATCRVSDTDFRVFSIFLSPPPSPKREIEFRWLRDLTGSIRQVFRVIHYSHRASDNVVGEFIAREYIARAVYALRVNNDSRRARWSRTSRNFWNTSCKSKLYDCHGEQLARIGGYGPRVIFASPTRARLRPHGGNIHGFNRNLACILRNSSENRKILAQNREVGQGFLRQCLRGIPVPILRSPPHPRALLLKNSLPPSYGSITWKLFVLLLKPRVSRTISKTQSYRGSARARACASLSFRPGIRLSIRRQNANPAKRCERVRRRKIDGESEEKPRNPDAPLGASLSSRHLLYRLPLRGILIARSKRSRRGGGGGGGGGTR